MGFVDRFGNQARSYAAARPTYPDALFAFLAEESPALSLAWDCATGNGQAAVALADRFERVIATDASAAQLEEAARHLKITYRVVPAEASGLEANAVDLLTVAQALHWFDLPKFFAEADRVLKPGGLLAVWSYGLHSISPEIDRAVHDLHDNMLKGFWTPERQLVDEGYASVEFPFAPVPTPTFRMEARWTLARLIGYLDSWSAVARYIREKGENPVPVEALAEAWGDVHERAALWPMTTYVRRKSG